MNLFRFLAVVFFGLSALSVDAKNCAGKYDSILLNIRDFGAKGDGVADDTEAIQRAVLAAEARRDTVSKIGRYHKMGNAMGSGPAPEVYFPAGRYRISDTIVFTKNGYLRGEGDVVIVQARPEKESFYFHEVVRARVEGLGFEGGATQLRFWTKNRGGVRIDIEGCRFVRAGKQAVECLSFVKKLPGPGEGWGKAEPWAPFEIDSSSGLPKLMPADAAGIREWFNSTGLVVSDSSFEECMSAVLLQCDTALIRDCRIVTSRDSQGAAFRLAGGKAHLINITGLAQLQAGKEQWWVEGSGILSLRNLRLDTDGEAGLCLLRSEKRPNPPLSVSVGHSALIVDGCAVKSAGAREGALVWLARGTQPSLLVVKGSRELGGKPVRAIRWESEPSLQSLEKIADVSLSKAPIVDQFMMCVSENDPSILAEIPEPLQVLVREPIPAAARAATRVPSLAWDSGDVEKDFPIIVNVMEHGIVVDPTLDQTDKIQAVLDMAREKGSCTVVFPGAAFPLSRTLTLPSNVALRGAGMAFFVQDDPEKDFFRVENAGRISFKALHFAGGRTALSATIRPEEKARIAANGCSFYDLLGPALNVQAGPHGAKAENGTEVLMRNCSVSRSLQALVTNAARSRIVGCFFSNHPRLNEQAFIENRGGAMEIAGCLTNPYVWQGAIARKKSPEIPKDWPYSNHLRWVDNWGQLVVADTRFGGEDEGICNVYNRSENGTVAIEGGLTRFFNDANVKAVISLEKPSRAVVLEGISALPWKHKESSLWAGEGAGESRIYTSCVMTPR